MSRAENRLSAISTDSFDTSSGKVILWVWFFFAVFKKVWQLLAWQVKALIVLVFLLYWSKFNNITIICTMNCNHSWASKLGWTVFTQDFCTGMDFAYYCKFCCVFLSAVSCCCVLFSLNISTTSNLLSNTFKYVLHSLLL